MKYRAIAAATDRSNAVGTVEFEPTPAGLAVVYLGVGSFREGYATGALASDARVVVPWSAVAQARLEGDQVFVEFDSALSPHNRLTLVNFSTGESTHHHERYRQRLVVRIAAIALAVVTALVIVFAAPRMASGGASVALWIGVLAAGGILLVGFAADRWLLFGGVNSDIAREQFVAELAVYLPTLLRLPRAPIRQRPPLNLPTFQGLLPRTTLAVVITLAASALGAVLMAHWIIAGERRPAERERADTRPTATAVPADDLEPPTPTAEARAAPAATATSKPATQPAPAPAKTGDVQAGGGCACVRASSPLWADPVPKLSVILLSEHARQKGRRTKLTVEIAVVNNSDKDVRELELHLMFYERDPPPTNARHFTENRVLYFEGPLVPGQAIMWDAEAEGTEFDVDNPVPGDIGPGGDGAAPLSRFAELLEANHRPVRLHGAMMLAYLGDPHAREAAVGLKDALRDDEAPYLTRLLQALGDLRVCQATGPTADAPMLSACVFNASTEAKKDIGVRVRALDGKPDPAFPVRAPPNVLYETTVRVPGELAPKTGVTIRAPVPTASPDGIKPVLFEAIADRVDLLP